MEVGIGACFSFWGCRCLDNFIIKRFSFLCKIYFCKFTFIVNILLLTNNIGRGNLWIEQSSSLKRIGGESNGALIGQSNVKKTPSQSRCKCLRLIERKQIDMKNIKFAISFMLVCVMCVGFYPTAHATKIEPYQLEADIPVNVYDTTVSENNAESWAYQDYNSATASEKAHILKARSIVMQQTDWVLDGIEAYYVAPDGTREALPAFSEVFPNWDITQVWAYSAKERAQLAENTSYAMSESGNNIPTPRLVDPVEGEILELELNKDFTCEVPVATSQKAPDNYKVSLSTDGEHHKYVVVPAYLTGINECNIGLSTYFGNTTYEIGSKSHMPAGSQLVYYSYEESFMAGGTMNIRTSTSSSQSGWGTFWVYKYLFLGKN